MQALMVSGMVYAVLSMLYCVMLVVRGWLLPLEPLFPAAHFVQLTLWVAYIAVLLLYSNKLRWPFSLFCLGAVAALLPLMTLLFNQRVQKLFRYMN